MNNGKFLAASVLILCCSFFQLINAKEHVHFSPEEILKLKQFRGLIGNKFTKDYMKMDGYLIRWLRAKNLNVDQAHEAFEKNLAWRKENKIDGILKEEIIPEYDRNHFCAISDALTRDGAPFGSFDVKKYDVRKYAVSGQAKEFIRVQVQLYEKSEELIYGVGNRTGKDLGSMMMVSDMTPYNLRQHACLQCVPVHIEYITAFERYYPGVYSPMFMFNAPRIFTPLLELLRPLLSPITQKNLYIYGPDKAEWQPKLLKFIAPENLPTNFGGTKATF